MNKSYWDQFEAHEDDDYFNQFEPHEEKEKEKSKNRIQNKPLSIAAQYGLGAAEGALWLPEIAGSVSQSEAGQDYRFRENLSEDIEMFSDKKRREGLDQIEEERLQNALKMIDPISEQSIEERKKYLKPSDWGIRTAAENITGYDLHPEGIAEKAANWLGFIKNPASLKNLFSFGTSPGELIKNLSPLGKDISRSLGAGTALQLAEEGDFGPVGTITAAIVGDLAGGGVAGLAKGGIDLLKSPKKAVAKAASNLVSDSKREIQKDLIKTFRELGIKADPGSLTDSNLMKAVQTKLSQSMFSGESLDKARQALTDQIKSQYSAIAETLGEVRFASQAEAGNVLQETIKRIRDSDLNLARNDYKSALEAVEKEGATVPVKSLKESIEKLEKKIKPGSVKGPEKKSVLSFLEDLKNDLKNEEVGVQELINNKIELNDIIDYDIQGGSKQLLKSVVKDLDDAILQYGDYNKKFTKDYISANKKFAEHAKTFRNRQVGNILKSQDPSSLFNKMNSVQGIRDIGKALSKSPEGKALFGDLKRAKLEDVIGKKMIDNVSQQMKLGTFSNLLEKGKNREIIKELLSPSAFKRLEKLQKASGKISESIQKFFNSSKSASTAADVVLALNLLKDVGLLLGGNPWPLVKGAGAILGIRGLSKLLTDEAFIVNLEEAILASETNNIPKLHQAMERLKTPLLAAYESSNPSQK